MKKIFLGFIISICFIFSIVLTACNVSNSYIEYKVEHYLENIDNNEYTLFETEVLKGKKNKETEASYKDYTGFSHSEELEQKIITKDANNDIKLYYSRNSYSLRIHNDNYDMGDIVDNSGTYKFEEIIKLSAEPFDGYAFDGWYIGNDLLSDKLEYDYKMSSNNININAKFAFETYNVFVDNQTASPIVYGEGECEITGDGIQKFKSIVTLTANKEEDYSTLVWLLDDEIFGLGNEISFEMPSHDMNFKVIKILNTDIYNVANKHVYFGSYPQNEVTDEYKIEELNDEISGLPTASDLNGWTDCNYYISSTIRSYMYYIDIILDNNKYRGVYFTEYRPYDIIQTSSINNSYQDDQGYEKNNVYWFEYNPIKWNILSEDDDNMLIMANLGLDVQEFYITRDKDEIEHNGSTGYVNNYALSNIRKWLNDYFYETAFTEYQKMFIQSYEIEDSLYDNVFLLSFSELVNIFDKDNTGNIDSNILISFASDYARINGAYKNRTMGSKWMLRSNSGDGEFMNIVTYNGLYKNGDGNPQSEVVTKTDITIKPVILLKKYPTGLSEINIETTENGKVIYDGEEYQNGLVTNGYNITLIAIPDEGYTFIAWYYLDDSIATYNNDYKITCYEGGINVYPKFEYYTLTTKVDNQEAGSVTKFDNVKISAYTEVALNFEVTDGYTFLGWYIGDNLLSNYEEYTYIMQEESVTIEARTTSYTVTTLIDNDEAGIISVYDDFKVTKGKTIDLSINLNSPYSFDGWYIGDTKLSDRKNYTYKMEDSSVIITAKTIIYTLNTNKVLVNDIEDAYKVSFDSNGGTLFKDQYTNNLIVPVPTKEGYVFVGWYDNPEFIGNTFDFSTIDKDIKVYAKWLEKDLNYLYISSSEDNPTNLVSNGKEFSNYAAITAYKTGDIHIYNYYHYGSDYGIYEISNSNKEVIELFELNWDGNLVCKTYQVTEGETLYIRFKPSNLWYGYKNFDTNIYFTQDYPNNGLDYSNLDLIFDQENSENKEITLWARPNDGYTFIGWYIDDELVETNQKYVFRMPSRSVEVIAKYKYYTLTLTKDIEDGGVISDYNLTKITAGNSITITVDVNGSYAFVGWYDGDNLISTNPKYTFEMPNENLVYEAKFAPIVVELTKNIEEAGSLSTSKNLVLGEEAILYATINYGYIFTGWYQNDELVFDKPEYHFFVDYENVYEARYIINKISISKNIDESGSLTDFEFGYVLGEELKITFDMDPSYTWYGWFKNGELLHTNYSIIIVITDEEISYVAKTGKYTLNIISNADSRDYALISFETFGGTNIQPMKANEFEYKVPKKAGYLFTGWYIDEELTTPYNFDSTIKSDLTLYAKFIEEELEVMPFNETFEATLPTGSSNEGKWYAIYALKSGEATLKMTYYGYNGNYGHNINIFEADKTTLIINSTSERNVDPTIITFNVEAGNVYYIQTLRFFSNASARVKYTLSVDLPTLASKTYVNGDIIPAGSVVNLFTENKPGYVFDGWYKNNEFVTKTFYYLFIMPEEDVTFETRYTAKDDIPYIVEHYLQNLDDNEYTLEKTDDYIGTADTLTNGVSYNYPGFITPEFEQININGDGSTVIELYYDRNKYTVNITKVVEEGGIAAINSVDNYYTTKNDNTYPWIVDGDTLTSSNHDVSTASYYEFDILISGTLIFDVRASSEEGYDLFKAYKNGEEVVKASGTQEKTNQRIDVNVGDVIKFMYGKDSSNNRYDDTIYITNIRFEQTNTFKYGKTITLIAKANENYDFKGWYLDNSLVTLDESFDVTIGLTDLNYEARFEWKKVTYTVNYNFQNIEDDNYSLDHFVTLTGDYLSDSAAEGITYQGFTMLDFEQVILELDKDIIIDIYYNRNSYAFYVQNETTGAGILSPTKEAYKYGEHVVIEVISVRNGYEFKGWGYGSGIVETDRIYEMDMPNYIVYLSAYYDVAYELLGNKLYFGTYPQSEVTDYSLIYQLNELASDDLTNWTDYGFYDNGLESSYMYYIDIDLDNDGNNDYRGVYLLDYRPERSSEAVGYLNSKQDDYGYELNTNYWFKYEQIEWDILNQEDGKALILANLIIDSREYQINYGYYNDNNYDISTIRSWLNDEFYNIAFKDFQKNLIELTVVDNSYESTGDIALDTNDTEDKIFLLSRQEINTYSSHNSSIATSYAMCLGIINENIWWSRSADSLDHKAQTNEEFSFEDVDSVYGIRPALIINLVI